MRELIAERYDFFGGPLTQLVAAERAFFVGLGRGFTPVEQWTSDAAIASAVKAMRTRPSRTRESTALAQLGMLASGSGTDDRHGTLSQRASSLGSSGDEGGKRAANPFATPAASCEQPASQVTSAAARWQLSCTLLPVDTCFLFQAPGKF